MQFPNFTYAGLKFNPAAFGKDTPILTPPGSTSGPSSFPEAGTDVTLDKALAYGIMQNLNPETRAKARKEELADALAFQKEQMRQATPYKLLFELPDKLYSAFALPGQIRLAGAQASAQTVSEGLRSAAGVQMPALNYQRPNIQYF